MQVNFRADRLRKARIKKKLTQEALAEKCNTSDRYIRDLEQSRKNHPSAEILCLLAASLEISMDELVDLGEEA